MKKLLFISAFLMSLGSNAQSICFVSADFDDADDFIVFWEKPVDFLNYDSVFIYRRLADTEPGFTKIGAKHMVSDGSYFQDTAVVTYKTTDYAISFWKPGGIETSLSPYHRPVILDYQDGNLVWTMYEKEFVTGDSWIFSYRCMRDGLGLGFYDEMGSWEATGNSGSWFDQQSSTSLNFTYQMEMDMPVCVVTGRANINTSRSNIKNQFSNAEAGVDEKQSVIINLTPNPTVDQINIKVEQKFVGNEFIISDLSGRIIQNGKIPSNDFTLNLAGEQNGTYLFTIQNAGKMHSKVFLKN